MKALCIRALIPAGANIFFLPRTNEAFFPGAARQTCMALEIGGDRSPKTDQEPS
jgi:hypothetical protein